MTIASMTGFARVTGTSGPYSFAWEAKSVNGRGLDIRLRTPAGWDALGEEARKRLGKVLTRGQCQVGLSLTRAAGEPRIRVNHAALASLIAAIESAPRSAALAPPSLDGLLAIRGVIEIEEDDDAQVTQELQAALIAALETLADDLAGARQAEGQALAQVIEGQLDTMTRLVAAARDNPARTPEAVRARIGEQITRILDASGSFDSDRLHQEAVLIATRADIQEEIDRLEAHIAAARELLAQGGAIGRRFDFLAQEFGREANTLCSKASDITLSRIGLDLKSVVDQFREQVQNVE
ncbi:MAG: YicC family protein [Salinarimonas sp.]|nr:YicC family protein [Salinarimonas sp.]